jgi:predicted nucleic acid-binding protein
MERNGVPVVIDTNVFVAAGFHRESAAARILRLVGEGALRMVWNSATQEETRHILERIPPLSWIEIAPLFREGERFEGEAAADEYPQIPDPDDRKFAALARAAGAVLITQDSDLLGQPQRLDVLVLTPKEYLHWAQEERPGIPSIGAAD